MPKLAKREFDVIAKLLRSQEPARTAALLVLVKGKAVKDVVEATGMSQPAVSQAAKRYREAHAVILSGYAQRKRNLTT